jgi:superfamily II DNA or RNA helicase
MTLLPGTEVHARGLRWEVVFAESFGHQTRYRLRSLDQALQGQELDLLHPLEPVEPLVRDIRPDRAAPLRNWLVYHQAFLLEQALGPDALLAVQPGRLRLEPYQLVPVVRALHMSRVRLLLADGVGLGKTIQAGLVLTELIARRLAHRILIVAPAGILLEQWRAELAERFGLQMRLIDRAALEQIRREAELGVNPLDHIPLGLASIDFLKQERVLGLLERTSYDCVVIDEAHHCTDLGAAEEREDTQRRRLAEVLARQTDALLLLTATPHDGNDRSFASLCELLDPSLVDGRGQVRGERYRAHVVRRLKPHIRDPHTGQPRFRERVVQPRPVAVSAAHPEFAALQHQLLELVAPALRRAFRARSYSDVLAYLALLKRSVSTAAACYETLVVVSDRRQQLLTGLAETQESRRQRRRTLQEIMRRAERFGVLSVEEELAQQQLQAEDLAQLLVDLERAIRGDAGRQRQQADLVDRLAELTRLALEAQARDPKLEQLVAEIQTIRAAEPGANVLVYTEYTDSQRAAVRALQRAGLGEVLTMSGEDAEASRAATTERFRSADGLVLVSTDAAAEGLNLHQRCHHLIHLELPFNPNRLEQRNGRIDRFGQQHDPVVRYLYLRGTFEEKILLRLLAKYERQRARLTFVPNTLGLAASSEPGAERLLKGLIEAHEDLFPDAAAPVEFEAPAEEAAPTPAIRELLEEVERSLRSFEQAARTHTWLGDMGLAADPQTLAAADRARDRGSRAGAVDLAQFVLDAARLDGGAVAQSAQTAEVRLPPAWTYGLDQLPGYDADRKLARLTTSLDQTRDAAGNPLGYLGRAHPLVRRALDRVRHLSLGGASGGQDLRASAVAGPVERPTLVWTYLGRVQSRAGRELERVLAVRVAEGQAPAALADTADWLDLADPARAIRTTGVFERHFQPWYAAAQAQARAAAAAGFGPASAAFVQERRRELEAERTRQDEWLRQRAGELLPAARLPAARQLDLFSAPDPEPAPARPAWAALAEPTERLAAFATDPAQPPRTRGEAEGVLRIYRQRLRDLDARLDLRPPEVVPLGVLMVLPERLAAHGA